MGFEEQKREAFLNYLELSDSLESDIEFDLYAQDVNKWSWLQEVVPTLIVSSAGGLLPFQSEGLLAGRPFYFRSEFGYAQLSLGEVDGKPPYSRNAVYRATISYPEKEDEHKFFVVHLLKTIEQLTVAPSYYEFPAWDALFNKETGLWERIRNQGATLAGWGFTAQEAYNNMVTSWSKKEFKNFLEISEPSNIPVEDSTRVVEELSFVVDWSNLPDGFRGQE